MNKVIYKYRLQNLPVEGILIPIGAKFLYLGEQDKYLTLWFEVEADVESVYCNFYLIMTGGYVPKNSKYLGTVQMSFHNLVAHVYMEKK